MILLSNPSKFDPRGNMVSIILSIRASLKQLIILMIVMIHQNSHFLIVSNRYLHCSIEMLLSSKKVGSSFLNRLLLWAAGW